MSSVDRDSATPASASSFSQYTTDLWQQFKAMPLTAILVVLCSVLLAIAPLMRPTDLTHAMLYPQFGSGGGIVLSRVWANFGLDDFLKMLSPILLHGGFLHLLFNMLALWSLGRIIESMKGTRSLLLTIVVLALISNTVQYLWGGSNNFGGMSGVIYGLFAYIWLWQLLAPQRGMSLPTYLIIYVVLTLAVLTYLKLPYIANAAHMGGFIAGLLYGALTALRWRLNISAKLAKAGG